MRRDFFRTAEDRDDGINDVAAEFKHRAAAIRCECVTFRVALQLAHRRLDREHLAERALTYEPAAQFKCGIVAEHVAHLHGELARGRVVVQAAQRGQRFARGFVEVNVLSRGDAARGGGHEVLHVGLDGDRLQPRRVQQFLLGHHRNARVRFAGSERRASAFVRLDDACHLKVFGRAHRLHFSESVRVARPDLSDADLRRLCSRFRSERQPARGERGSGQTGKLEEITAWARGNCHGAGLPTQHLR